VKVHPRDDIYYYIDLFKKLDHDDITITKDGDISVLFKETDLLITGWSMTSYQALALGVPVISINPDNIFDYSQSFTKKGIPVVNKIEKFIQKYDHFTSINGLNDFAKERIEFLKEINTFSDGKSAVRLANLVRDILNGNIIY
jgi:spore coat polysaccharide biosynthesis predicted glycosyltransferase SpsG